MKYLPHFKNLLITLCKLERHVVRATFLQRVFYFKIMDVIDKKITEVLLDFSIKEITLKECIKKIRKVCTEPVKRDKCECHRPIAEEFTPTTCLKCDGWISMKKYPYKIV